jgi:hypothetical protein
MKLKLIPLLLLPALMLLVACGGTTEPTSDIGVIVEASVKKAIASLPLPTPRPTPTPSPTATTVPTSIPTPEVVIKEVIVEKEVIKEVQVEVIKEVLVEDLVKVQRLQKDNTDLKEQVAQALDINKNLAGNNANLDETIVELRDAIKQAEDDIVALNEEAASTATPTQIGQVTVSYPTPPNPDYVLTQEYFKSTQYLESVAAPLNDLIAWPQDLLLSLGECGVANAFYYPDGKQVAMCLELFYAFLRELRPLAESDEQFNLWVNGVWAYSIYHEIGHALIDILELPAVGREEDAVDQLAALVMLGNGDPVWKEALDGVLGYHIIRGSNEVAMGELPFWDEHSLSLQRAYDLACIAYGHEPNHFSPYLAFLPQERAQGCAAEYERIKGAWDALLEPHLMSQVDPVWTQGQIISGKGGGTAAAAPTPTPIPTAVPTPTPSVYSSPNYWYTVNIPAGLQVESSNPNVVWVTGSGELTSALWITVLEIDPEQYPTLDSYTAAWEPTFSGSYNIQITDRARIRNGLPLAAQEYNYSSAYSGGAAIQGRIHWYVSGKYQISVEVSGLQSLWESNSQQLAKLLAAQEGFQPASYTSEEHNYSVAYPPEWVQSSSEISDFFASHKTAHISVWLFPSKGYTSISAYGEDHGPGSGRTTLSRGVVYSGRPNPSYRIDYTNTTESGTNIRGAWLTTLTQDEAIWIVVSDLEENWAELEPLLDDIFLRFAVKR